MSYFDIKRDSGLIAAGSHFWCEGHLAALPIDDISRDSRYCLNCHKVLKAEAELLPGKKRRAWVPQTADSTRNATDSVSVGQGVVAKIETPSIPPITEKGGIMQHRGRHRKEGEVHRVTKWRRRKAEQGVLV